MNFLILLILVALVAMTAFTSSFPALLLLALLKALLIFWFFMELKTAKYWGLLGSAGIGMFFMVIYLLH
ncbi:hypothetical protein EZJ49_12325 [Bdellovibrio bacteriovorus]|uniref:hypothetical protein n=1 Tax=Bdellovibrio bacteriovorus TaxID=959 RepID=UPI0021D06D6E|nr:hypothetical protein [Bdellovibrio bacteriovorus]UXR63849.1 hypothetical protein EZJ49_12325 [Bdellovibrio bacteriovorus]